MEIRHHPSGLIRFQETKLKIQLDSQPHLLYFYADRYINDRAYDNKVS